MKDIEYIEEIKRLKQQKNAVILAHNYQRPEIQELADLLGDSLDLSRRAAETSADMIIFCGVRFMAETAKILAPQKTVILPNPNAGCPMADMVTADDVIAMKAKHPKATVVCYVNTPASVKAAADICVTSANAATIIEHLKTDEILFFPDKNLAAWCQRFTKKRIIPWSGYCYVHNRFSVDEVRASKALFPEAKLLVHPECPPEVVDLADEVLSTNKMVAFATTSKTKQFLIATEEGIIHRMRRENPDKQFYAAGNAKSCFNMKKTTLQDIYLALQKGRKEIILEETIMNRARHSLEEMVKYG
jgi:quinolinate synthase